MLTIHPSAMEGIIENWGDEELIRKLEYLHNHFKNDHLVLSMYLKKGFDIWWYKSQMETHPYMVGGLIYHEFDGSWGVHT